MAQHLLQSAFGYLKLPFGRLLRFLDENMEHDNASLDDRAVEHSGDAFRSFDASLKEPFPHGTSVRHAKVRAKFTH
jgi:hypothetical protein